MPEVIIEGFSWISIYCGMLWMYAVCYKVRRGEFE